MYGSHTTVYHSILAMMRDPPVRLGKKTLVEKSSDEFPKFCRSRPIATFVGSSYMILPWIFVFRHCCGGGDRVTVFFLFQRQSKGNKRAAAEAGWQGDGLRKTSLTQQPSGLLPVIRLYLLVLVARWKRRRRREGERRREEVRWEELRPFECANLGTLLFLFLHP